MDEEKIGSEPNGLKAQWDKQQLVNLYSAVEAQGAVMVPYIIPEITRVVDTVACRTGLVHKIIPKVGVQVWVKERGQELENWAWNRITVRQPRRLRRYPRPFRWPREEATKQCHCKIGKMVVKNVEEREVLCTRCKQLVGSESYPRRIERAEEFLRKADARIKSGSKVQKRVPKRNNRKKVRRSKNSVKARKRTQRKSKSSVVVRPKRRSNAKSSNRKTPPKRAAVPKKRNKTVSKNKHTAHHAVPKTQRARPAPLPPLAEGAKAP